MPAGELAAQALRTDGDRVLFVDAFPDEAALYSEFFTFYGLHVQVCDRPDVALSNAVACPPDVIVARIRQPAGQMDGIELTARLRRTARTCEVPIVLLTTSIFPTEEESARRAGCNSVMLLPVSPDELLDQVRSLITHG